MQKNNEEPFVKAALEDEGWEVKVGSQDEDFKGIDLKVKKEDTDDEFGDDDKKNVSAARDLKIANLKVIKAWDD